MKYYLMLALMGLLSVSCSKVADSDADDAGASSSISAAYSSSSELLPSSSVDWSLNTELRTLNIIVDYQKDSVWVDSLYKYVPSYGGGSSFVVDSTFLRRVYGDTLEFMVLRYSMYREYIEAFFYHCFVSRGACDWKDPTADPALEGMIMHLTIGNATSTEEVWNLAASDSAVMLKDVQHSPLNGNLRISNDGFAYQNVTTVSGPHMTTQWDGFRTVRFPVRSSDPMSVGRISYNHEQLLISVDFTKNALWEKTCYESSGMGRELTLDTLRVLDFLHDSISLSRVRYKGNSRDSIADLSIAFIGKDTVRHSLNKGLVGRAMASGYYSDDYPLTVSLAISAAAPEKYKSLAALDSIVLWSTQTGVDSFYVDSLEDQGIFEPALWTRSVRFNEDGWETVEDARPYPLNIKYTRNVCTVRAIRQ